MSENRWPSWPRTRPPGEPHAPLLPPEDGFLIVDPAKFPAAFAADVDALTTTFMAVTQVPWGLNAVGGVVTQAAWKSKPSSFMITTEDQMVPPTAQRATARRAGGRTQEVRRSGGQEVRRSGGQEVRRSGGQEVRP
jgi:hypothetical protein